MNIFAYGTLMIPVVMHAVTARHFRFKKAILKGYARFTVQGEVYPGIVPQANAITEGIIYLNADAQSVVRLDEFEGECYQRKMLWVETEKEEILDAATYVFKPEYRAYLSPKEWDVNTFTQTHLERFLESYRGFSKDLR